MSIAVSIVSTIIKSAVKSEVENELSNELFGISIDGISEKGINKINDFINKGKSKIDNILSEDKMKSLAISEDNMAYVVAEIKGLFSEMEFTDEIFRQFKYDRFNLRDFLWNEYIEDKTGYIECKSDIKKSLLFVSETLIGLMRESEDFEKDISIQISNSVDDTRIEMREEFNKLDTYNQMILKILEQNQNAKTMKNMNTKLENKNISIFISYSSDDGMVVDELDKKLQNYGYTIERDIRDLDYTQSIKEFMKRIRKTDYSIILLSDRFLKSENCMREFFEFIKDDNYKDRIIPIILDSAKDIWRDNKGIEYTIFWKDKEKNFKEQLKRIDEESKSGYIEELRHISMIKDSIGEVIKIFRDMKIFDINDENIAERISHYIKKKVV
ncbi:toll/interleukin-1 receptor domain-containing protein [Sporofaciens musculi]|uniref:toll/interleukin-1 receptor domain-containing protein n=1 Tax=Sporofaciens musculi TaxID=2681861 RepID=UPI0025A10DB0|nr:toll/interleukin-1 receptor domain-containing protein [Sporofaciens musculi]